MTALSRRKGDSLSPPERFMRSFNKVFVIAMPRCATVSMCEALGQLGVKTAHLGRIYGEPTQEHHHPERLHRMHEQILAGDYDLDILQHCDGLADYPACSFEVIQNLDSAFPGSLFLNVRRDEDVTRWLQSVERQFVGLQLMKAGKKSTEEERRFMQVMLKLREMTFGQAKFEAEPYRLAYIDFQKKVADYFAGREDVLLDISDIQDLESSGFQQIAEFLQCDAPQASFPRSNAHSELPSRVFMQALEAGEVKSQTGIKAISC